MKICVLVLALILAATGWTKSFIEVKSRVQTSGQVVLLSEVLDTKELPAEVNKILSNQTWASAPKIGEVKTYSSEEISKMLRKHLAIIQEETSEDLSQLQIKIPKYLVITGPERTIKREMVISELVKSYEPFCLPCEIDFLELNIPELKIPVTHRWQLARIQQIPRGKFTTEIDVVDSSEKILQRAWITGDVRVYKTVPVLLKKLSIGERVQKEDVQFMKRDVTFSTFSPASEREIIGSEVRRVPNAYEIVWNHDLVRRKAVELGESVEIVSNGTNWTVSLRGLARNAGFIGDSVEVINPETKKSLRGIVVSKGVVEIK